MVTRKLIRITSPEAAALAANETTSSSAAAEDSTTVNKQPPTFLTNDNKNETGGGKKRALPSQDTTSGKAIKKRQRVERFVINLSDVPPQLPIPKSEGRQKEGASKYAGVSFNKPSNKWQAKIMIDRKVGHIGYYENEEEAAIDYARAVLKYRGQDELDKARGQKKSAPAIDLSNVPSISPILKSAGGIKEGSSKYAGVTFNKAMNKWETKIIIEGKQYFIGYYEDEVFAATDYARAAFKYKGHDALNEASKRKSSAPAIDLSNVPPQLPILKSERNIKGGTSKYVGVNFEKKRKIWKAVISIKGKLLHIGYYKDEEEAAADYARALFKFKGQDALNKAREQKSPAISIDLSDVPPQPLLLKSITEGSSKYAGVYFDKSMSKWKAVIKIDVKLRHIGWYKNEEEAAADYARAVFKYKGQEALDEAREQNKSTLPAIDLSDVPPQPPILRYDGHMITEGSSTYVGVSFNKRQNKWQAKITIDGRKRHIGFYENEEEAAIDYARAVFKYISQEALDQVRE